MPANVLVVEYEPRYLDRLRQAFAGRPLTPVFAKDGSEALRALEQQSFSAIVLSWILPKTSAADLIRAIRSSERGAQIPILLTVSGYNGRDSRADARRVGATDLLPKPFSDSDLLARLAELTGIDPDAMNRVERELGDFSIDLPPMKHPAATHTVAAQEKEKLTSDQIFSGVLDDDKGAPAPPAPPAAAPEKPAGPPAKSPEEDLDELLSQTLITLKKKKKEARRDDAAVSELDRLVEDTLSGLPKSRKKPEPPVQDEPFATPSPEEFDRVHASSPIVPLDAPGEQTLTAKPGARIGQFVLRERIATGGMAEIWKARMEGVEGFEKFVAIKRILPHLSADQDFVDMFINEAKIAARLNHPNIIHIYDLGRASGAYYIAMELVDGHDLKTALRQAAERGLPISLELAIFIAAKLAVALDYAHRKEEGLVHRDVSPQNVLISWEGDIKLCDFGIAKATSKVSHTRSGALKGKIQYMSPEQASGLPIDRRSDVFSLGVVLFEMLTGRKLFHGESEISVLEQVRDARAVAPSEVLDDVPPEIDAIVLRALARDPEQRYASAGDMARELDRVLYAFRPTPGAADLAVWMHQLWRDIPAHAPVADPPQPVPQPLEQPADSAPDVAAVVEPPPPVAVAAAAPSGPRTATAHRGASAPMRVPPPVARSSRRPVGWIVAAILGVAVLGGAGAWMVLRPKAAAEPAERVASATESAARPAPEPILTEDVEVAAAPELIPIEPSPEEAEPSPDLVAQEVERRLEGERQRLEAMRRQREQAREQPAPPPVRRSAPEPAEATPRAQEPIPREAAAVEAADSNPVAAPPQEAPPQPAATVQTETVATQTVAPQPPPVRRGDLVPPGTPGLVEPELLSLRRVTYPPMAKLRKIEGIVVLRVLVSETGEVLEVDLLRGVTPDVGIDQAAVEAVRGGKFRAASKDGVAVKAYKNVTVPFRL